MDDEDVDSFLRRVAGLGSTPPPGFAPLRAGERFARYEIVGTLGAGGMGRVYAARRTEDGAHVALKVLRPEAVARPGARERFAREAQAVKELSHSAIVPVWDFGEARGLPFLVMPRLEGCTLRVRMRSRRRFDHREAAALLGPVAEALAEAHARGVVHRDVKPENLWLEPAEAGERARLLDFGLARISGQPRLTATGASFGTPRYMPPEQLRSAKDAGPAADQYALAVVLYELLAGRPPYEDAQSAEHVIAKSTQPPPPLERVPEPVMDALRRALAADAGARFADVSAFAVAALASDPRREVR